jgi:hypothetical protein
MWEAWKCIYLGKSNFLLLIDFYRRPKNGSPNLSFRSVDATLCSSMYSWTANCCHEEKDALELRQQYEAWIWISKWTVQDQRA